MIDADNVDLDQLVFTIESSNANLISPDDIRVVGGTGTWTLQITLPPDLIGDSRISIQATAVTGETDSEEFVLSVVAENYSIHSGDGFDLQLDPSDEFAILKLDDSEYARWRDEIISTDLLMEASNHIYGEMDDAFDFLVFALDEDHGVAATRTSSYTPVKNDVQGIGLDLFDMTPDFGSAGRLQGIAFLNFQDAVRQGAVLVN